MFYIDELADIDISENFPENLYEVTYSAGRNQSHVDIFPVL